MPLFGTKDQAITANDVTTEATTEGAPLGTWALVKAGGQNSSVRVDGANAHFGNTSTGSRAAVDVTMFGNTTMNAFIPGQAIGVFAVDSTEIGVVDGPIIDVQVTDPGCGYFANTTVALTVVNGGSGATINANANSTGRIAALKIQVAGDNYRAAPLLVVAAATAQTFNSNTALFEAATFNANTGVDAANDFITISSNKFVNNDLVTYTVAAGNTAVDDLVSGNTYYVIAANSTGVKLSLTSNGAAVALTPSETSETGHTLTRNGFLEIGSNVYQVDDDVTYTVAAGNTAVVGLTSGQTYYVVYSNSTGIYLSETKGGSRISLTPGVTETGHTLQGRRATGKAVVAGAKNAGVAHTGWVIRKEGSGGRAGRVSYEVLVAGGISNDGSDDTTLPDS